MLYNGFKSFIFVCRISLSKAHAKLSLRTEVLEQDVLIAVLLFESSLTLKYGKKIKPSNCS